jgi:hypothetical protein
MSASLECDKQKAWPNHPSKIRGREEKIQKRELPEQGGIIAQANLKATVLNGSLVPSNSFEHFLRNKM